MCGPLFKDCTCPLPLLSAPQSPAPTILCIEPAHFTYYFDVLIETTPQTLFQTFQILLNRFQTEIVHVCVSVCGEQTTNYPSCSTFTHYNVTADACPQPRERERKNMSLTSAAGLRGPADPTQISDLNFCTSFLCLCGLCCLLSSSFC